MGDARELSELTRAKLVARLHEQSRALGALEVERLETLEYLDAHRIWRDDDCRDMVQWTALQFGIGTVRARRMVGAARALAGLPRLREAIATGVLSPDKAYELARFAAPATERKLISWARKVAPATIRARADEACASGQESDEAQAQRFVRWRWNEERSRLSLYGEMPADSGAIVVTALSTLAERIPQLPVELPEWVSGDDRYEQRLADALYVMAVAGLQGDPDHERSTIVIHADAERLARGEGGFYEESGGIVHADTLARLACCSRIQWLVTHRDGRLQVETTRSPSASLWRAVRKRDGFACTFPGCARRGNLVPHHIAHHGYRGPTRLDNLVCVCAFHHKLLHHHDWRVALLRDGTTAWFKPSGERFEPGPAPESHASGDPPGDAA